MRKNKSSVCRNCEQAKVTLRERVGGSWKVRRWCACDGWKEALALLDRVRGRRR